MSFSDGLVRNTAAMDMSPLPCEEVCDLDALVAAEKPVRLVLLLSAEQFYKVVPYPVIVETWSRLKAGRQKRLLLASFTMAERRLLARYYAKFYRWHLISGTPRSISCRATTLQLLRRFVSFCVEAV